MKLWSDSFAQWRSQFLSFGFKEDDLFTVYRLLAAVILLNDLEFTKIEASSTKSGGAHLEVSYVHNFTTLKRVAELLCVNEDELMQALLTNGSSVAAKGQTAAYPKSWEESVATRDALARTIYSRLFGWIVKSINSSMNSSDEITYAELFSCYIPNNSFIIYNS